MAVLLLLLLLDKIDFRKRNMFTKDKEEQDRTILDIYVHSNRFSKYTK